MPDDPRIAYFDAIAAKWDAEEPSVQTMTAGLAARADLLKLQPGQDLLEVGCGTGKTTAWLAAQVAPGRVTAIDFAPEMVAHARAKGIDADFRVADICSPNQDLGLFDIVLCFHAFPHFRDQAAALHTCCSLLKSGGRVLVMHLAGSQKINGFHAKLRHPVCQDILPESAGAWDALLSQAGLARTVYTDRDDLMFLEAVPTDPTDRPDRRNAP